MFGKEERKSQDEEIKKLNAFLDGLDKHSFLAQIFKDTEKFAKPIIQNGSGFGLMATIQRLNDTVEELKQKLRIAEQMEQASNRALQEARGNDTLKKIQGDKNEKE